METQHIDVVDPNGKKVKLFDAYEEARREQSLSQLEHIEINYPEIELNNE